MLPCHAMTLACLAYTSRTGYSAEASEELHEAVLRGSVEMARAALDSGASLNARDSLGYTPLHRAADEGEAGLVELLLDRGAGNSHSMSANGLELPGLSIDSRDNDEATPLMLAASGNHVSIIKLLVSGGADVHLKDEYGLCPLHYAAEGGHVAAIDVLLEHGADPSVVCAMGKRPIDVARAWGFPAAAARLGAGEDESNGKVTSGNDGGSASPMLPEGAVPLFAKRPTSDGDAADVGKENGRGRRAKRTQMPENLQPVKLEL